MAKYKPETLVDYYERRPEANNGAKPPGNIGLSHLNVFYLNGHFAQGTYKRRDFYNVALILNKSSVQINDVWYDIKQPALVFSTPATSYEWRAHRDKREAWLCIFTEDLLYTHQYKESLISTSLTHFRANPVFSLDNDQCKEVISLFQKMKAELKADYALKHELLRNYLSILFHLGNKLSSALVERNVPSASSRLTSKFLDLLNSQFPIEVPMKTLDLKSAADFAFQLSVHINHLNRAVMETTGKTTTELIGERLLYEALSMLRCSHLTVAQIAYALGFKEVSYFQRFFKKIHGITPGKARRQF
jgi:AraC-like DNA-binding protein